MQLKDLNLFAKLFFASLIPIVVIDKLNKLKIKIIDSLFKFDLDK